MGSNMKTYLAKKPEHRRQPSRFIYYDLSTVNISLYIATLVVSFLAVAKGGCRYIPASLNQFLSHAYLDIVPAARMQIATFEKFSTELKAGFTTEQLLCHLSLICCFGI